MTEREIAALHSSDRGRERESFTAEQWKGESELCCREVTGGEQAILQGSDRGRERELMFHTCKGNKRLKIIRCCKAGSKETFLWPEICAWLFTSKYIVLTAQSAPCF
jgi:hypothetical protein